MHTILRIGSDIGGYTVCNALLSETGRNSMNLPTHLWSSVRLRKGIRGVAKSPAWSVLGLALAGLIGAAIRDAGRTSSRSYNRAATAVAARSPPTVSPRTRMRSHVNDVAGALRLIVFYTRVRATDGHCARMPNPTPYRFTRGCLPNMFTTFVPPSRTSILCQWVSPRSPSSAQAFRKPHEVLIVLNTRQSVVRNSTFAKET